MMLGDVYQTYATRKDRNADLKRSDRKCVIQADWFVQCMKAKRRGEHDDKDAWEIKHVTEQHSDVFRLLTNRVDNTAPMPVSIDRHTARGDTRPAAAQTPTHYRPVFSQEAPSFEYRSSASETQRSPDQKLPDKLDEHMQCDAPPAITPSAMQPGLGSSFSTPVSNTVQSEASTVHHLEHQKRWTPSIPPSTLPNFPPTISIAGAPLYMSSATDVPEAAIHARSAPSGHANGYRRPIIRRPFAHTSAPVNPPSRALPQPMIIRQEPMPASEPPYGDLAPTLPDHTNPNHTAAPRTTEFAPRVDHNEPASQPKDSKRNAHGVFARGHIVPCSFHVLDEDKHKMAVMLNEVCTKAMSRSRC